MKEHTTGVAQGGALTLSADDRESGKERKKAELLAPAGNMEALYGVLNAGCDAVYLSGKDFGARAYAENFSDEELLAAISVCRLFGKKLYLTVNTLLKEKELSQLSDYLFPLVRAGLHGVIVQDPGVIRFLCREFPSLPIHASTQLSVTEAASARLLKRFHVTRIVPARELSLKEMIELKEEAGIEVEAFIHGAMCYSYSGKCLLSSCLGGRSGNRGRCSQPCRLPYRMPGDKGKRECYLLSMKDMYTLPLLPELLSAGIDSLKIEGRMKKPVYAAGTCAVYRKYIDLWYRGEFRGIDEKDASLLSSLYLRSGLSEGYYRKPNGAEMITMDAPGYSGADEALVRKLEERYLKRRPFLPVRAKAHLTPGKEAELILTYEEEHLSASVCVRGERVEEAKNAPLSEEKIAEQLKKTNETFFEITQLEVKTDGQVFLPVRALNALRREGLRQLQEKIIACRTEFM